MARLLRTIENIHWAQGMRVLIRIDGDVAMKNGRIVDDFRIQRALSTIKKALLHNARVCIISHRGRPNGIINTSLSQKSVARFLSRLLKKKVIFVDNPFSKESYEKFNVSDDILFFENIRFWKGEEENSNVFARALAHWGDIYINDAFANSHRKHASMLAITKELPSYAGINLTEEVTMLGHIMYKPERPFVAILGGAKIETKLPLIKRFLRLADHVLIGGALANTLFYTMGLNVGKSLADKDIIGLDSIIHNKKLHIPTDVIVARMLSSRASMRLCDRSNVRSYEYIVDIGPETKKEFIRLINTSKMVVWNGPLGFAEVPEFAEGTKHIAKALSQINGFTLIGGGDTIALLRVCGVLKGFSYISTGGGAMLEYLSGAKFPVLDALAKTKINHTLPNEKL